MSAGRRCAECAYAKVRRGSYYCKLLKQRVSPDYRCGRFKPKG